jgi:hypothetical protein
MLLCLYDRYISENSERQKYFLLKLFFKTLAYYSNEEISGIFEKLQGKIKDYKEPHIGNTG